MPEHGNMSEREPSEREPMDRLLDSALSTYASPNPGLEDRVLRSIAAARITPSVRRPLFILRWLPWTIAVPIAAALALFFLFPRRTPVPLHNQAQIAPQSHAPASHPLPLRSSGAQPPSRVVHTPPRRTNPAAEMALKRSLPKKEIFPTFQPLSPQEQALADLAAHAPEAVRKSLVAAQPSDAPITISAIRIQPLEMPDPGQN